MQPLRDCKGLCSAKNVGPVTLAESENNLPDPRECISPPQLSSRLFAGAALWC
jgi:hypothetical protein